MASIRRARETTSPSSEPSEAPAQARAGAKARARARHKRFKALRRRAGMWFLATCGPGVVRGLARTWRLEVLGQERVERLQSEGGFLVAMWHGRMLLGVEFHTGRPWHVLVSPSPDGDLSERLLRAFGYEVVRGTTSRGGGARALRAMLKVLDGGSPLVVTPDGPRGPRHSMNPGLAWMARATGYPILPLGMVAQPAWRLRSWDRFTIPKPRSRVVVSYGEPLLVPRGATEAELEGATETVRARILEAERRGFELLGAEVDW